MLIQCPNCGNAVVVNNLGRKRETRKENSYD